MHLYLFVLAWYGIGGPLMNDCFLAGASVSIRFPYKSPFLDTFDLVPGNGENFAGYIHFLSGKAREGSTGDMLSDVLTAFLRLESLVVFELFEGLESLAILRVFLSFDDFNGFEERFWQVDDCVMSARLSSSARSWLRDGLSFVAAPLNSPSKCSAASVTCSFSWPFFSTWRLSLSSSSSHTGSNLSCCCLSLCKCSFHLFRRARVTTNRWLIAGGISRKSWDLLVLLWENTTTACCCIFLVLLYSFCKSDTPTGGRDLLGILLESFVGTGNGYPLVWRTLCALPSKVVWGESRPRQPIFNWLMSSSSSSLEMYPSIVFWSDLTFFSGEMLLAKGWMLYVYFSRSSTIFG